MTDSTHTHTQITVKTVVPKCRQKLMACCLDTTLLKALTLSMKLWSWPDPFLPDTPQQRKFKDSDYPFAALEMMQILIDFEYVKYLKILT